MSMHKLSRHQPRSFHGFDDSEAPSSSSRRRNSSHRQAQGSSPRVDRKALQLCRQVEHTLGDVLAGDCDDEILQCLDVLGVQPAPDASRLLVTVAPNISAKPCPVQEVISRLSHVAGHLRSEVASAITRKKAPTLIYQVVPNPGGFCVRVD